MSGESRITVGAALLVGFFTVIYAVMHDHPRVFQIDAIILFTVPALATGLIVSGIFKRMDGKSKSN